MKNPVFKKYLIIILFILVSLGLLIGSDALLKGVRKRTEVKYNMKKYGAVLGELKPGEFKEQSLEGFPETIKLSVKVFDDNNDEIANIFEAYDINGWGNIKILVGVDLENKVIGVTHEVDQSADRIERAESYINKHVGKSLNELDIDGVSGATDAYDLIDKLFADINVANGGEAPVELNTYEKLFGKDYTLENEVIYKTGEVSRDYSLIKRYDVVINLEVVAHTYFVEREGLKITGENYGQEPYGSIELQIIVDHVTTRFLGVELDMDKYHHSSEASYTDKVRNYIEKLVLNNIFAVNYSVDSVEADGESGVTESGNLGNTMKLVVKMLEDLSVELKNTIIFSEEEIINEETVLTKQAFINGDKNYTLYVVEGIGEYFNGQNGKVQTAIVLDENNLIVDTYFVLYEHSKTHKKQGDNFIASLVANKQDITKITFDFEFDGSSGATNSYVIIQRSIYGLTKYLREVK